jgi:dimethylargininase
MLPAEVESGPMALRAITREVSPAIGSCELTHLQREPIDVPRARSQHHAYEEALAAAGCHVERLAAEPALPDSVFVEDAAVVTDELAVVTRPGAVSRRPETPSVARALAPFRRLAHIEGPATLDGGDVIRLGRRLFVGRSGRTNDAGVDALRSLVSPLGYSVQAVPVSGCLHLKSAATAVAPDTLLLNPAWVAPASFGAVSLVEVDPAEPFAGNALWVGGAVLFPTAFPRTRARLEQRGLHVVTVDLSELAKAEGALTCCSLVFDS